MHAAAAVSRRPHGVSTEMFAMVLFLIMEVMFFASLASTYVVLRTGSGVWKPPGMADLVSSISIANTVLLFISAGSYFLATRALRQEDTVGFRMFLAFTLALGVVFIAVQVFEGVRLQERLPMANNLFGSVFYTYIGLHAAHVLGGVVLLATVMAKALKGRYNRYRHVGVTLAGWYWYFVVLVWVFIYLALYVY